MNTGTGQRIKNFVMSQFPLARQRAVQDADALLDGGIIDSMGILDLVHFIESGFSITISDEELMPENFQTIEKITSFVETKSLKKLLHP